MQARHRRSAPRAARAGWSTAGGCSRRAARLAGRGVRLLAADELVSLLPLIGVGGRGCPGAGVLGRLHGAGARRRRAACARVRACCSRAFGMRSGRSSCSASLYVRLPRRGARGERLPTKARSPWMLLSSRDEVHEDRCCGTLVLVTLLYVPGHDGVLVRAAARGMACDRRGQERCSSASSPAASTGAPSSVYGAVTVLAPALVLLLLA